MSFGYDLEPQRRRLGGWEKDEFDLEGDFEYNAGDGDPFGGSFGFEGEERVSGDWENSGMPAEMRNQFTPKGERGTDIQGQKSTDMETGKSEQQTERAGWAGHETHMGLNDVLDRHWKFQKPIYEEIKSHGIGAVFESGSNVEEVFLPVEDPRRVACIDEGTHSAYHLAGSGILLGQDEAARRLERAGVEVVTYHQECGAAKLKAQKEGWDTSDSDKYAKEFSGELAESLGMLLEFISIHDMARPSGVHTARSAFYVAAEEFHPELAGEDLPPAFVISRRYTGPEASVAEAEVSFNIATGDHGFGDRVTEANPFVIFIIGDPKHEISTDELREELEELRKAAGGRILIQDYTPEV